MSLRRRRDDHGTISVLAVGALVAVLTAATLAIDIGRISFTSRDQQGATDRAALDALRAITDLWNQQIGHTFVTYDPQARAEYLAAESLGVNEGASTGTSSVRVEEVNLGQYDATTNTFVLWNGALDLAALPTAVRVETTSTVDTLFVPSANTDRQNTVIKEAIAQVSNTGALTVGSSLATVDVDATDSEILDGLLSDLLGGNINLGVVGYQGLATAEIELGELLLELGITAGSPDAVVDNVTISQREFFEATARALTNQNDAASLAAATEVATIASETDATYDMTLGDFLSITNRDVGSISDTSINVLDLVRAAAYAGDGTNFAGIPDLALVVPGLASIGGTAEVIEAAGVGFGPGLWDFLKGDWMTTADNVQLNVDLTTAFDPVIVPPQVVLGIPRLFEDLQISVPIHLQGGRAHAAMTSALCLNNRQLEGGTTETTTTGAAISFGDGSGNPTKIATLRLIGGIPVADIFLTGTSTSANGAFAGVHFPPNDETVSGGASTLSLAGTLSGSAITIQLLGGPAINTNQIHPIVDAALDDVFQDLDAQVLDRLIETTGMTMGHADTTLSRVQCDGGRILVK